MAKWTPEQIVDTFYTILDEDQHPISPDIVEGYQRGQEAANNIKNAYHNGTLNSCPHCSGETAWGAL